MNPLHSRTWAPSAARNSQADAPVALLLHGITGSSESWWRVGPALADAGWRVIALDLPGHGDSPRMERPMKAGEWAALVHHTIRALIGAAAVDLAVGHSAGGATILEVVALDPVLCRRVVLEDPPGAGDVSRPEWAAQLEQEVRTARRDPERFTRLLLRQNPVWHEGDAAAAVAGLRACDIGAIGESERRGMGYRVADLVASVQVPSLLILADEPRSAVKGAAREAVLAAAPHTMTVAHFATGHVIHRDAFDDYMRTLLDWTRA